MYVLRVQYWCQAFLGIPLCMYVVLHPTPSLVKIKGKVVDIRLFDTDEMEGVNEMYFTSAVYSATQHPKK